MLFNAVNAKVSAMSAGLLKRNDYESLCHSGTVVQVGNRLRERPGYRRALAVLEGTELHREQVEQQLPLSLYDDFTRIRHFLDDKKIRDFWIALFRQYQINYLKLLLCAIYDERSDARLSPEMLLLFGQEKQLRAAGLAEAKTVAELIEQLKETELYTLLSEVYQQQPSLFALERQMDLYYYLHLWKSVSRLPDIANRKVMERIKGTEIDLLNILWIYRLKKYFNVSDTRIYAYLIPINYRLKTDSLRRMAEGEGINALLGEIAACPYGEVFGDFTHPEQSFANAMKKTYTHESRKHPGTLAAAAAYLFAKEQEIRNITTALEGVRYGLPPEEIMAYLCI